MDHLAVVHDFDMTELDSHNIGVLADVIISEEGVVQARGDVLMFDEFCFQFKTCKEDAGRAQKDKVREEHITMTDVENFPMAEEA